MPLSSTRRIAILTAAGALLALGYGALNRPPPSPQPIASRPRAIHETASGNYLVAYMLEGEGRHAEALERMRAAVALAPGQQTPVTYAFRLAMLAGDLTSAERYARQLPEGAPGAVIDPFFVRATATLLRGDAEQAKTLVQAAPTTGLAGALSPLLAAWIDNIAHPGGSPLTPHELALRRTVNGPFMFYHLALINDLRGHPDHARAYYRKALEGASVPSGRLYQSYANLLYRLNDRAELDALAARVKTVSSGGTAETSPGDPASRPVANARQGIAELFFDAAAALAREGSHDRAMAFLHLSLATRPEFPAARYLLAALFEQAEQTEQAIAAYQRIPANTPLGMRGRIRGAMLHARNGQEARAIGELEAMYVTSHDPAISLALGDVLRMQGRHSEAVAAYTRVIEANATPAASRWALYYARGVSLERMGAWEKAEADFRHSLELQPDQPDVMNYLAYSWVEQGRHLPKARAMLSKAVELRPTDPHIIDSYGWALYRLGEWRRAADYLELAVELLPADPTVNDHLGDVYYRTGRLSEANFQWRRVLILKPDPEVEQATRRKLAEGLPPLPAPVGAPLPAPRQESGDAR